MIQPTRSALVMAAVVFATLVPLDLGFDSLVDFVPILAFGLAYCLILFDLKIPFLFL